MGGFGKKTKILDQTREQVQKNAAQAIQTAKSTKERMEIAKMRDAIIADIKANKTVSKMVGKK